VTHNYRERARVHEINGRKVEDDPVHCSARVGKSVVEPTARDDVEVTDEGDDCRAIAMLG